MYQTLSAHCVPSIALLVTELENMDLQTLVDTAINANAGFFDTAERYGGNLKTALGLGCGEMEMLTRKLLDGFAIYDENLKPIVAAKFTPSPWRTTSQSVVDACKESRQHLRVDQIDLYQLHMPHIVQPLRFMGMGKSQDEIYWDGLAECYHQGLVKNVGVCNYGPTLLLKCQEALAKRHVTLAANQIAYSLIGRHNGAQKTLDVCNENDIKVLAFFPFPMGVLTGKYSSGISVAEDTIASLASSKKTKLELRDLTRYATGDGNVIPHGGVGPLLKVMDTIAKNRGKTIA